jgi:hypothetical protein
VVLAWPRLKEPVHDEIGPFVVGPGPAVEQPAGDPPLLPRELRRGTQVPGNLRLHEHRPGTVPEHLVRDEGTPRPHWNRVLTVARLERRPAVGHPRYPSP